jgi:hypothetical protein
VVTVRDKTDLPKTKQHAAGEEKGIKITKL